MDIAFYFDPICPWCWVTSRWLTDVSDKRDLKIDWRPFSLALKNNNLQAAVDESRYAPEHRASHQVLRAIEAAVEAGGDRGKLYGDIGRMHHVEGYDYTDTEIELMLGLNGLDAALVKAADDTSYDATLQKNLDEAIEIVGSDVGVPLVVFSQDDGKKVGYFGPILIRQPTGQAALDLWDGLSKLASSSDFYELKRSRPSGGPDTTGPASTMVC